MERDNPTQFLMNSVIGLTAAEQSAKRASEPAARLCLQVPLFMNGDKAKAGGRRGPGVPRSPLRLPGRLLTPISLPTPDRAECPPKGCVRQGFPHATPSQLRVGTPPPSRRGALSWTSVAWPSHLRSGAPAHPENSVAAGRHPASARRGLRESLARRQPVARDPVLAPWAEMASGLCSRRVPSVLVEPLAPFSRIA